MLTVSGPNQHKVTIEATPNARGEGYVVVARLWSLDETAIRDERWVRFDTEEEADREARRLSGSNWPGILSWHKSK